jgi:4-diphosphocytidyl-2-C-methyl-D-erythritol kinase
LAPVSLGSVTVRVPAKVNLQLAVGPLREDGFHELATVFHAVGLFDDVTAGPADGIELAIAGEGADQVPADANNLAWKAAAALAAHAGVEANVRLHLEKRIPVAGGMAGGSADAAGTLLACDALWQLRTPRTELMHLAATLGSDVPFALQGGTAIGTGRGEQLTPALTKGSFHWVFALADGGLSTPAVYAECDRLRAGMTIPSPYVSDMLMQALRAGDPILLGKALDNDLQAAAISLRPSLAQVLEFGEDFGALGGVVSGSGPTCAFIARDLDQATDLAVALTSTGLTRTVTTASSPAPGARIVA